MQFYNQMLENICKLVEKKETEEMKNLKYFMTFHGKSKSFWYFKFLPNGLLKQTFFNGEEKQERPIFFDFTEIKIGSEFCLVGELINDNFSNEIFLIQDILSLNTIEYSLPAKHQIIHEFLETIITTSMDPFLFQVKILYNNESQMLDLFFKTILISYNVNLEGIILINEFGYEIKDYFQIIEAKNRVDLDLNELESFISKMKEVKIINHLLDFKESNDTFLPFRHNEIKFFYTKKDFILPDIYYLYQDEEKSKSQIQSKNYYLALIPSLEISLKMNLLGDEFIAKYTFHEFHQKWIPLLD